MQTNKKNKNIILQFLAVLIVFIGFSCNKSTKIINPALGELSVLEIKNLPEGFSLLNTIEEVNKEFTLIFEGPYQLTVTDLLDSEIITDPEDAKISFSGNNNSVARVMTISAYGLRKTYQIQTNAILPTPALVEIKNLPKGYSFVKVEHGTTKDVNGTMAHKVILATNLNEISVSALKMSDFVTFPSNIRPEIIASSNNPLVAEALVFEFDGQKTRYEIEKNMIILPTEFSIKEIYTNSTDLVLDQPNYDNINNSYQLFGIDFIIEKINNELNVKMVEINEKPGTNDYDDYMNNIIVACIIELTINRLYDKKYHIDTDPKYSDQLIRIKSNNSNNNRSIGKKSYIVLGSNGIPEKTFDKFFKTNPNWEKAETEPFYDFAFKSSLIK